MLDLEYSSIVALIVLWGVSFHVIIATLLDE